MTDSTDRLVDGLLGDLEPVRPLPRLRSAFALILSLWAVLLGIVLWTQTGSSGVRFLMRDAVYLASFIGLAVAAGGGAFSALAAGVPGRERLELTGLVASVLGLGAAAAACVIGWASLGAAVEGVPSGSNGLCFRNGALFSLLPAGVIFGFLVRGWTAHPLRAAGVALLGSGALGVGIAHLGCSVVGPQHLLLGHLSVPIVLSLLGLYPLGLILRRLRG